MMAPMEVIKSVTMENDYAALVTQDGRYGVAQMMAGEFKSCFYDSRDLANEVFEVVAKEVLANE